MHITVNNTDSQEVPMKFKFAHNNFNVKDLQKSLRFYEEALDLKPVRTKEAPTEASRLRFFPMEPHLTSWN